MANLSEARTQHRNERQRDADLLVGITSRVRTLADTVSGSGGDFTHHVYGVGYSYDLSGRVTTLTVPHQLAPRVQLDTLSSVLVVSGATQTVKDGINYTYDTGTNGTGWLTKVDGLLPSDVFRYTYAPRGEIATLSSIETAPDGPTALPVTESRRYDGDGPMDTLFVSRRRGVSLTDTLRNASLTVDAEGRVVTLRDTAKYAYSVTPTTVSYLYSGLGQMLSSDYETTSPDGFTHLSATETSSYDALGNWVARTNSASSVFSAPGGGSFTGTRATRAARYTSGTLHERHGQAQGRDAGRESHRYAGIRLGGQPARDARTQQRKAGAVPGPGVVLQRGREDCRGRRTERGRRRHRAPWPYGVRGVSLRRAGAESVDACPEVVR